MRVWTSGSKAMIDSSGKGPFATLMQGKSTARGHGSSLALKRF